MKKVVKFGGSSLASARQFKKVADIIKSDKSRRYVVPSAPGKRSDKDEKVTDLLYACYDAVAEGRSYKKILEKIKSRAQVCMWTSADTAAAVFSCGEFLFALLFNFHCCLSHEFSLLIILFCKWHIK